jgi:hypothetical protein
VGVGRTELKGWDCLHPLRNENSITSTIASPQITLILPPLFPSREKKERV